MIRATGRRTPLTVGLALLAAGCGALAPSLPPAAPPTARPTVPPVIAQTARQVEGALRAAGFVVEEAQAAFRPAEPPVIARAGRAVYRVILSEAPADGQLVVYAFATSGEAADAGRAFAAYLASGPGRVQFPPDARHVLRQVGTTLVYFPWSPSTVDDPRVAEVPVALESIGQGIAVPD